MPFFCKEAGVVYKQSAAPTIGGPQDIRNAIREALGIAVPMESLSAPPMPMAAQ
jgi:hypothetical protein